MDALQRLTSRANFPAGTRIEVSGVTFGGPAIVIIAGPCTIEDKGSFFSAAESIKSSGAHILRGSLFKTRTAPYTFQGLREEGLDILRETKRIFGLPIAQEITSIEDVSKLCDVADILFVGARNMQNIALLRAVGQCNKPIILKRGFGCTIDELLLAAEFILNGGNSQVILCERGIRTFEHSTRFTLDISAIPVLKQRTHLPVVIDPSHAAGQRELIPALSLAAIAAGADGLMIEVHPDPDNAQCDAPQQLSLEMFSSLMPQLRRVADAVGRQIPTSSIPT